MSKLFNIRPRWRNLLLARILLFAISIVLSSSGEDIGPNDTIEESLSPSRFSGGNVRDLQSKSAKAKSNKSGKRKGSKSKASKISVSKSKSGKASSKMGKSSYKSSKSKASKVSGSKSKSGKSASKISKSKAAKSATESKSKIGKSLKSLDSGDDTDERDGNSSSDSIETTNITMPSKDNEQSDPVKTSFLNRDDIDYVKEDKSLDSSSYSSSMDTEEAKENVDIISTEEEIIVSTAEDGKTYNVIQFPVSSKDETNIDTTHLDGDFMEERIDESEDTELDIDEIMTEIIEESRAFENMFDESDEEFDPSRESVE